MCEFCQPTEKEKEDFMVWYNGNPYLDEDETTDYEGIDCLLVKGTFYIGARFESGYVGDSAKIKFNYCPMCGKKF
jgi:hypothetical protein